LTHKGYDTRTTILACYSGVGLTNELKQAAATDDRVALVGLDQLYRK
jgi:hypothetical protein